MCQLKEEIIKNKTQLYSVYKKFSLNIKTNIAYKEKNGENIQY